MYCVGVCTVQVCVLCRRVYCAGVCTVQVCVLCTCVSCAGVYFSGVYCVGVEAKCCLSYRMSTMVSLECMVMVLLMVS